VVAPSDNSIDQLSNSSLPLTGEGVVVDLGTGDGIFVYQSARRNPKKFYIGIDVNVSPLEKISEKIHRKPAKGGAPNVLFISASVEDLPSELDGIANEVHVHFPWGSLLRAVATGETTPLRNIRCVCASEAVLEVVIGLDPTRDQTELERLGLQPMTLEYIDETLTPRYEAAGFEILERGVLPASDWPEFKSSWGKRLKGSESRPLVYVIARAI
jgi:16S rRNA (adenine(1408)-N(1))-methyltransferase